MPYSYKGQCLPDGQSVLDLFNLEFPHVDGTSVNDLVSSSISTATPPVISYTVLSRQWSSDTLATRTGEITLNACTIPTDYRLLPDFSIALLIGCCVMFGIGFMSSR